MTLKSNNNIHNLKRKNHKNYKITFNIGGNLGVRILNFFYLRGPQKQSRPKGSNNLSATASSLIKNQYSELLPTSSS